MAVLGNKPEKIPVDYEGETIEFLFPPQHSKSMRTAISKLLKNRFVYTASGDTKNMAYETRAKFFDANVIGVENLFVSEEEGHPSFQKPLHEAGPEDLKELEVDVWTDCIPEHWKAEISGYFEESAVKSRKKVESE